MHPDYNYDHGPARAHAESLGLIWDEPLAAQADRMAHELDLSQPEFTRVVNYFSTIQKWQWSPTTWTWGQRFKLAFHFIFNPKGW